MLFKSSSIKLDVRTDGSEPDLREGLRSRRLGSRPRGNNDRCFAHGSSAAVISRPRFA
jgi:hypothetical protein